MAVSTTGTEQAPAAQPTGTIREAANAFEQFLTSQEGNQEDAEASPEVTETDEVEATEEQAPEEADEAEQGGQSDEDDAEQQTAEEKVFTVRVDGKEEQVPLSELLAGYSRTKDYTQKTQVVASERKQLAQLQESVRAAEAEYAELLPKLRAALQADLREPNWEELRATNPTLAAIEYDRFQERKAKANALRAEEERVRGEQEKAFAEQRNQILIEEQQRLLKRPELQHWRDTAKADADAKMIVDTLKDAGFSDDELQIYDHRAMVVAWKAAQYDQSMRQRNAARQSVQEKATKAPVAKPGNGAQQAPSAMNKANARLTKSGSVKDAAKLFEHLF